MKSITHRDNDAYLHYSWLELHETGKVKRAWVRVKRTVGVHLGRHLQEPWAILGF